MRLDAARRIVDVNDAAERLFGRSRDQLVGRPVAATLAPRLPSGEAVLAAGWHASTQLRSVYRVPEHVLVVRSAPGDIAVRATGVYERDVDGEVAGAVLAFRPSERPGHEPTGAEVVATVSHELRAPLTSVKGYTALLLNRWGRLPDDNKLLMLEQIHADADRVTRLINELLDISRLEIGRLQLRRQLVDLPSLARRVVEKLGVTYPELHCTVDFPVGFPRVYADPDKIEQVLTNLVENAVKYAKPDDVRVAGEVVDGVVAVAVHDRGEGISASELTRLFRKFSSGHRRDGRPSGVGLGLWISRGLVEVHGGSLTALSVPGEGSVFRFTLPLVDPDELIDGGRF